MSDAIPTNLRLLCVGIGDYSHTGLASLGCASTDAKQVFSAFQTALGQRVICGSSLLLTDISASEFLSALNTLASGTHPIDDLLVIFFSGHAIIEGDVLQFVFVDGKKSHRRVSSNDIAEVLRKHSRPATLLILDCCHANFGTDIGISREKYFPQRVSLLAGSGVIECAKSGKTLSVFTEAFVTALLAEAEHNNALSIKNVQGKILELMKGSEQSSTISFAQGVGDIVLRDVERLVDSEQDLVRRFVSTLSRVSAGDRETLWYSLAEFRECVTLQFSAECFHTYADGEALWKVRRAIGSALGRIKRLSATRDKFCEQAFSSGNFTWETVALIAKREQATLPEHNHLFVSGATQSRTVDTQWLAFLYLADALGGQVLETESFGKSKLWMSAWGVCELFERSSNGMPAEGKRIDVLKRISDNCDSKLRDCLREYVALCHPNIYRAAYEKSLPDLDQNLIDFALTTQRGQGGFGVVPKWVYSKLYGSWRGHLIKSATSVLNKISPKETTNLVEAAQFTPAVPVRMGIFDALSDVAEANCHEAASWGFKDSHPWVRRAALEWTQAILSEETNEFASRALDETVLVHDVNLPGALDLLFEYARLASRLRHAGANWERFSRSVAELPPSEQRALSAALKGERIPVPENGK